MTSEKQIKANQANAKLSTGPQIGKSITCFNALKRGLFNEKLVLLDDEDEQALITLEQSLHEEFKPSSATERILVAKMISTLWRLNRAIKAETEMIDLGRLGWISGKKSSLGEKFDNDYAQKNTILKNQKYLTSIDRQYYRAKHELERMQEAKKGNQRVLPPIVIDVLGSD